MLQDQSVDRPTLKPRHSDDIPVSMKHKLETSTELSNRQKLNPCLCVPWLKRPRFATIMLLIWALLNHFALFFIGGRFIIVIDSAAIVTSIGLHLYFSEPRIREDPMVFLGGVLIGFITGPVYIAVTFLRRIRNWNRWHMLTKVQTVD